MMRTEEEIRLNESVKRLRLETFEKGYPFMLVDNEIAPDGFINEYSDGSMKLMKLGADNQTIIEVRSLNSTEINQVRNRHGLRQFHYA
ncbi:hypothetical protein [Dyadobacter sp. CY323]|uniref:hypothetical protein n=1 Tax=Dyadobacter sp. CY323 TaxID=2907302 RepID=UPI001F28AF81|nr:hypothetical protein [Dyadobacter sp. CY323]MCE6991749.1 hypothetical protein [Dyadobacter sp. CY323]